MPTKTTKFDPARFLKSPELQAELLTDAMATGDADATREALYKALGSIGDSRLATLLGA